MENQTTKSEKPTRYKVPRTEGWVFVGKAKMGEAWQHLTKGLRVIVSIDNTVEMGRAHHLSVSKEGDVPSDREMAFIAESFGMPLDGEDNDGSDGRARHLWSTADAADSNG